MEASSSVSINTIVPEALDDSNYELWSSCMEDYLLGQDLWDVVIEDEPEAAEETGQSSSSDSWKQNMKSWRKRNALALHAIKVSCGPYFLPQVVKLKSAKEAWNYLFSTASGPEKLKEQSTDHSDTEIEDETRSPVREELEDIEIIAEEESTDSDTEDEDETDYDPFVQATMDGEWSNMEKFIDDHPEALSTALFAKGRTALHHVLNIGSQEKIAASLVARMSKEDLEIQDNDGYTTLAIGATEGHQGQLKLLQLMASKNPSLPNIGEHDYTIPVVVASWKGFTDTTRFLYSFTDKDIMSPECGIVGSQLLNSCINIKLFDIASDLVKRFPKLLKQSYGGIYPIHASAKSFSSFSSRNGQKKWNWVEHTMKYAHQLLVAKDEKLIHDQALAFLRLVCVEVSSFDGNTSIEAVYEAMLEAATHGNVEFINEMLKANPNLIHANKERQNIFTRAVANRQEKVFSLIYGAIEQKDILLSNSQNEEKNNILHCAALLAPTSALDRTSGDALQMQRELQWFQEVWNVVKARYREDLNANDLTPSELFSKSHKKLMEAGEKSMKDTAQSSTVVGALIVTIMFAVAFTVPGGSNQDTGYPLFVNQALFKIFIICDALSLYSSTTSVLVFLGILTSRYAEEDFLLILPRKLMIGISTLFFSITTMMVTFCAALAIMLDGRLQLIFPIVLLAFVPVILFLSSIFPLLSKMYKSTFGPSIFDRDIKLPRKKEYKKIVNNPSSVNIELDSKKEEKKMMNNSFSVDQIV